MATKDWDQIHKQIAIELQLPYDFVQYVRCLVGVKKLAPQVDPVRAAINEQIRKQRTKAEHQPKEKQNFYDAINAKIAKLQGYLIVLRDFDDKKMAEFINLYK